jgi:hypothetical protein
VIYEQRALVDNQCRAHQEHHPVCSRGRGADARVQPPCRYYRCPCDIYGHVSQLIAQVLCPHTCLAMWLMSCGSWQCSAARRCSPG